MTFHRGKVAFLTAAILVATYIGGCAVSSGPPAPQAPDIRRVSPQQAQRVYRVMAPLLAAMDKPKNPRDDTLVSSMIRR